MDYARIYREFIADRRSKEEALAKPFERHHVLPRSMGGGDESENLIKLSLEDHFFAHLLLWKAHGDRQVAGVWFLLRDGKGRGRYHRREFALMKERVRAHQSRTRKGRVAHPNAIAATIKANAARDLSTFHAAAAVARKGVTLDAETRHKISQSLRSNHSPTTDAQRRARSQNALTAARSRLGVPLSEEHKAKIGLASRGKPNEGVARYMRGRKQSPEQIAKRVASRRVTLEAKAAAACSN